MSKFVKARVTFEFTYKVNPTAYPNGGRFIADIIDLDLPVENPGETMCTIQDLGLDGTEMSVTVNGEFV